MNYFAHAWIASQIRPEPRFVLGSMLPDLLGFLRIRPPQESPAEVAAGMTLHHATDAVFHALPGFREENQAGVRALLELGLRRGSARAASHVGIEFILDRALAVDAGSWVALYRSALAEHPCLRWASSPSADAVSQMAERLTALDPSTPAEPAETAERIRRTLESRPRLALRSGEQKPLEVWLSTITARLTPMSGELAQQTLHAVKRQRH